MNPDPVLSVRMENILIIAVKTSKCEAKNMISSITQGVFMEAGDKRMVRQVEVSKVGRAKADESGA